MANPSNSGQIPMFTPPFPAGGGNQNVPAANTAQFPPRPQFQGMGDTNAPPAVYSQQHMPGNFPPVRPAGKGTVQNFTNGFLGPAPNNVPGQPSGGQRFPPTMGGPPSAHPPNRFMSDSPTQHGPLLNGPGGNFGPMPPPPGTSAPSYPQTAPLRSGFPSTNTIHSQQTSQSVSGQFNQQPFGTPGVVRPPLTNTSTAVGAPSEIGPGGFGQRQAGGVPLIQASGPQTQTGGLHTQAGMGPPTLAGSSTPPGPPTGRPVELPAPFHGYGQYSHQIGMQLTPGSGLTPNSSEPTSQRSSRAPSPATNPVFEDMEGGVTHALSPDGGQATPPFTPPKQNPNSQGPSPSMNAVQNLNNQFQPKNTTTGQPSNTPFAPQPPMGGQTTNGQYPPRTGQTLNSQFMPPNMGQSTVSQFTPSNIGGQNTNSQFKSSNMGAQTSNSQFPPPSGGQRVGPPSMPGPPLTGMAPTNRPPLQMNTGVVAPPPLSSKQPPPISMGQQRSGLPQRPTYPQMNPGVSTAPAPWGSQVNPPMSSASQPYSSEQNLATGYNTQPPTPGYPQPPAQAYSQPPTTGYSQPSRPMYPQPPATGQPSIPAQPNAMVPPSTAFGSMSLQQDGQRMINLLQEKILIPNDGVETPKPRIAHDFKKVNCSPDVFRCTLNAIPQTSSLQNKARLPLGILIHPFKDLSQLPVIQSSVIVRCRSCRTYINPFVYFADQRRWKCNLCYRVNELPDEFSFDPVSKTYGDPQRRPEIRSATMEFIAPSEYMLRPPQPAVYLFVIDVSFNAVETGYLGLLCQTLLEELDKLPGDGRTQIGFLAFDRALHFFNLAEGLSQPQMLTVSDIEDVFLPCPDNLLVNLQESKELVIDLLNQIPNMFDKNSEVASSLGAALQAAYKMLSGTGGRISVFQTVLPTSGPGALQSREESVQKSGKNVLHLGPATDFYKKLALDCSAQQIAVDLFMLNGQYADIASLSCASKYSGGCMQYYPSFHTVKNPSLADKFEADLRRYLTRKIGFESVMRIRCTKGLSIHTFHGNFFVRSTDLLSLPNVNPDAGYGMQMSIEDSLTDVSQICFQAALLYTSSKGERRIRVHTLCVPTTNELSEVYAGADQQAISSLLAKMAVDRCVSSSLTDAREALINAALDSITSYSSTMHSSQRMGSLMLPHSLRLLPLYVLAMMKSMAFRLGSTKLDDRVFAMEQCKTLPMSQMMQIMYPSLYPIHDIDKCNCASTKGDMKIPQPRLLHLSAANVDRTGVYLMDTGDTLLLYVGSAVREEFYRDVLDSANFPSIPEGMTELPELDTELSEKLRNFLSYLLDARPFGVKFIVVREDSKYRNLFFQRMVDDRSEATMSYYEFLQYLQKQGNS